jgi:hypoxanthine phosphoribosyltransferase
LSGYARPFRNPLRLPYALSFPGAMSLSPPLRVLLSAAQLRARVASLAQEIVAAMPGDIHVVGVLTSAFVFAADLIREIDQPLTVDFVGASSYGSGTTSRGTIEVTKGLSVPVRDRQVLLVDDIVDTGRTLAALQRHIRDQSPSSVRTVCLLDKPSRRQVPVTVDHVGFTIADQFVVGYGLDANARYRNLRHIAVLDDAEPGVRRPSGS